MKKRRNCDNELALLQQKYQKVCSEKMELEYLLQSYEDNRMYEKEQSEEILMLHETARKLKHDMKNHIMVIATYLQENNLDEARRYLSKILDKLNGMYTYVETGNSLMSHIINAKFELAHQKGIEVKAKIENLSFEQMDSVDFSALLSNMLDNAIEAEGDCVSPKIEVEIMKKRGYNMILVKNRIEVSILDNNPKLLTSKVDKSLHGYGIKQIRELVSKYSGLCDFYEEDVHSGKMMFCACVMI